MTTVDNKEQRDAIGLRYVLRDAAEYYFQTPYSAEASTDVAQVFTIRHEGKKYAVAITEERP
jgi:hypothetical protein